MKTKRYGTNHGLYRRLHRAPWLLATSLPHTRGSTAQIVRAYAQRMQIEEAFRDLEHAELLKQVRHSRCGRARVVALGGGAYASKCNRREIEDCGVTLWLDPPYPILWARVSGNDKRPLAKDPEAFRALYDSRRDAYAHADYRITSDTSPAGIDEIFALDLF